MRTIVRGTTLTASSCPSAASQAGPLCWSAYWHLFRWALHAPSRPPNLSQVVQAYRSPEGCRLDRALQLVLRGLHLVLKLVLKGLYLVLTGLHIRSCAGLTLASCGSDSCDS